MEEPLSIGLFYVNDFEKLRFPLYEMIRTNKKVANEFYPSILFNYFIDERILSEIENIYELLGRFSILLARITNP